MKRSPIVLLGTVAGVAAVLALNPDGSSLNGAVTASGPGPVGGQSAGQPGGQPAETGGTIAASTPSAAPGTVRDGSAKGKAYSAANYGQVQLRITVKDGRLTKVQAVTMPGNDGRSKWISENVESLLIEQALTAQSASINGISGATFTSMAFAKSLQSALDKLAA